MVAKNYITKYEMLYTLKYQMYTKYEYETFSENTKVLTPIGPAIARTKREIRKARWN